jgi:uncharacterized protein YabE (DUF348 family)
VRRTIRYGLYGAVLAALVAGPMAWANAADRTVNVVIDGHSQAVRTSASDVAGVLASAGLVAGPHDLLAPRAAAPVHDGSRIVLRRGRLLQLDVDGRRRAVWTTAATVSEALGQLGYPETDFVSVSRSKRLPLGPTAIALRSPIQLTVVHDGERETVTTTAATAGQLVADLGLEMLPSDKLSAAPDSPLRNGQTLRLTRVNRMSVTRTQSVPFATRKVNDVKMVAGKTEVVTAGADGTQQVTYVIVYVDGRYEGTQRVRTVTTAAPTTEVVHVGTKVELTVSKSSTPSIAAEQAYAQSLLPSFGWAEDQMSCLISIWNHESHWNPHAANPSGAYGIPQALPGSKMGPGWQDDAKVQIKWGLGYIKNRYVSPCGAWDFWQGHGWY